ncbi:hypothetical protein [Micrococcoides hystricis]|uniref:Uncharacterized protein n=1 Tax=Micrococcoides hystricis TaxID=1572761 RepID=A0ABV6PB42_9MICC
MSTVMHIEAEILLANTHSIESLLNALPTTDLTHPTVRKLDYSFKPGRHALVVCMEISSDNFVKAEEIGMKVLKGIEQFIRTWAEKEDQELTVEKHGSFLLSA